MSENPCHYCGNPDCFVCDECEESWCNCDCETRYADEDENEEGIELFTSCIECEQLVIPIDDEGMAPDTCGDCETWLGMCDGCGADLPPSELVTYEDGGTVCAACDIIITNK